MREVAAVIEAKKLQRRKDIRHAVAVSTGAQYADGGEEFTVELYYKNDRADGYGGEYREPGVIYTAGCNPNCDCDPCQGGDEN